jgi:hypothetical protein
VHGRPRAYKAMASPVRAYAPTRVRARVRVRACVRVLRNLAENYTISTPPP